MAGPFSVNPNSAPNLSPVQFQEGTTIQVPTVQYGEALASVVKTTSGALAEVNREKVTSELNEEFKSVRTALELQANPLLAEAYFGREAMADPFVKSVLREFNTIGVAMRQGRLPSNYAVERMEALVQDATVKSPAFANEIKAAAQDSLGFNPSHRVMQQAIAGLDQQVVSAQKEAAEAAANGATVEEWRQFKRVSFENNMTKEMLLMKKTTNDITGDDLVQATRLSNAEIMAGVTSRVRQQHLAGGLRDPIAEKGYIDEAFSIARSNLLANLPTGVDATTALKELEDSRTMMHQMADNGSLLNITEDGNKLAQATYLQDAQSTPIIGRVYTVMGPERASALMSQLEAVRKNPATLQAFVASGQSGELKLAAMWSGVDNLMDFVTGKAPAVNEEQAGLAMLLGMNMLKTAKNSEDATQAWALAMEGERLQGEDGKPLTIAAMSKPVFVAKVRELPALKPLLEQHFNSYAGDFVAQYQEITQAGKLPKDALAVDANGQLILSKEFSGFAGPGAQGNLPVEYNKWATGVNGVLALGAAHGGAGNLSKSTFPSKAGFIRMLTEGVEGREQELEEAIGSIGKPEKWERVDGKLQRVGK